MWSYFEIDHQLLIYQHIVVRVCGTLVVAHLDWTPMFESCMPSFVVKNAHQKDKS